MIKFKGVYILIIILISGCSSFKDVRDNTFYTDKDMEILKSTTEAIGFDYGFDSYVNLNYIISNKYSDAELKKRRGKFLAAVRKYNGSTAVKFLEKICMLRVRTLYRIKRYSSIEYWKKYTYVKKYLYPSLEKYYKLLEEEVFKINPAAKNDFSKRKVELEDIVYEEERLLERKEFLKEFRKRTAKRWQK